EGTSAQNTSGSPTGSALAPALADESSILRADATKPDVQAALTTLALDMTQRESLRYLALRRLEEQAKDAVVPVAETLASRAGESQFLRENGTAVLVRTTSLSGQAALARVKKSAPDLALLAARLGVKGGNQ